MNLIRWSILVASLSLVFPVGSLFAQGGRGEKDAAHPPDAVRQFGTSRLRHSGFIRAMDRSGTLLATGSSNGTVRVWDLYAGNLKYALEGVGTRIYAVSFSPNGTKLAVAGETSLSIWRVKNGQQVYTTSLENTVSAVTYSPDGSTVALGTKHGIRLWDSKKERTTRKMNAPRGMVRHLAFTPDGTKLVSAGDEKHVRLWRVRDGQQIRTYKAADHRVMALDVSPNGKWMVSAKFSSTHLTLWNLSSGETIRTLEGHKDMIDTVAFSPEGRRVASGSGDRTVRIWNPRTGEHTATFSGHPHTVEALAYGPDGTTITAGSKQTITFWNTKSGRRIIKGTAHSGPVRGVAFSPDGRLFATGSEDRTIKLWNTETGTLRSTLTGHQSAVETVRFAPDGKRVASAGEDGTIRLWNVVSGAEVRTLTGYDHTVHTIDFTADGRFLVSGGERGRIRVWSVSSGDLLQTLRPDPPQRIHKLEFAPDGKTLVTGGWRGLLRTWTVHRTDDTLSLEAEDSFSLKHDSIYDLTFSPDGQRIVVGFGDGSTRIYQRPVDEEMVLANDGSWDYAVDISPDGMLVASSSGGAINLYSSERGSSIYSFTPVRDRVLDLAFSPDGRYLAAGLEQANPLLYEMDPGTWEVDLPIEDPGSLNVHELLKRVDVKHPLRTMQVRVELVRRGDRTVQSFRRILLRGRAIWIPNKKRKELMKKIRKLGHSSYRVRSEAQQELQSWLPDHIPNWALVARAVSSIEDPEIHHRLRMIRRRIGEMAERTAPVLSSNAVRTGIRALQQIGGSSARGLLRKIAKKAKDTPFGEEASRALDTLK